jgi:Tol biopolymer transport system component
MPSEDRLDSWKEIAGYLQRDVTTVQRWEKREGMPVHRHLHDKLGSVYAYRTELDAWAAGRKVVADAALAHDAAAAEPPPPSTEVHRPPVFVWTLAAGAVLVAIAAAGWLLHRGDYLWRNPLENARLQKVTDFGGSEQAAAVSRDGRFVAFLSDREGRTDVWVTQVGTGQFYDLTRGRFPDLVNPQVRALGFSPDGALVTFWARGGKGPGDGGIGIWAVPVLGGAPRPYLEGAAEFDWSGDGTRVVYHTPGPGDPMFVRDADQQGPGRAVFAAPTGLHAHFPLWSRDGRFIYFVQGSLQEAMDVWRIPSAGGEPQRITPHASPVSHPVLLDDRTLLYLAADRDGTGPALYAVDVERRRPRRISAGLDRYTSLAASADGRHLVVTLANPKGALWRLPIADRPVAIGAGTAIPLTTGPGFSPRLGPGYHLYVSSKGASDGIWKLADGASTELWSAPEARVTGGPEIAPDGRSIAFSVARRGHRALYVMDADGSDARLVTESLELQGAPAWSPDGASIISAVQVDGRPQLFRVLLDGAASPLVREYALDPVWSPGGDLLVYSGADVGTTFPVKAISAAGEPRAIPALTLTRGSRRLRFLPGRRALVAMRGEIRHKDLWLFDLDTGAERRITELPPGFDVRDFDISPDGREIVLERVEEHSDIVLIDLAPRD